MENIALYNKLASLPDQMKSEVSDFIDFLLTKAKKNKEIPHKPSPKFGSGKGMFIIGPDFDEPLDDFKDYM
jgi:uncharacterized protein DUF2281